MVCLIRTLARFDLEAGVVVDRPGESLGVSRDGKWIWYDR
jgi:hypothetical protein